MSNDLYEYARTHTQTTFSAESVYICNNNRKTWRKNESVQTNEKQQQQQTPGKCDTDTKWFVVPTKRKKGNEKRTVLVVNISNPLKIYIYSNTAFRIFRFDSPPGWPLSPVSHPVPLSTVRSLSHSHSHGSLSEWKGQMMWSTVHKAHARTRNSNKHLDMYTVYGRKAHVNM